MLNLLSLRIILFLVCRGWLVYRKYLPRLQKGGGSLRLRRQLAFEEVRCRKCVNYIFSSVSVSVCDHCIYKTTHISVYVWKYQQLISRRIKQHQIIAFICATKDIDSICWLYPLIQF